MPDLTWGAILQFVLQGATLGLIWRTSRTWSRMEFKVNEMWSDYRYRQSLYRRRSDAPREDAAHT